jgi:hypothetical protein
MKKKFPSFILLLLLIFTPTFAQFRAGLKAGANLSNMNTSMSSVELEIYEPRMGFHAGVMAEYMFCKHFGLQGELMYVYSGATINPEKYLQGLEVPEGTSVEGYVSMNTIQLPLYAKVKFTLPNGLKIYGMAGGFATYAPAADQHIKFSQGGESMKVKWSLYDPNIQILDQEESNVYLQQRFNGGIALEAGMEFSQGLTAGIGFRQVLNNMAAYGIMSGSGSIKPTTQMWTATFSVGYYF